jgi:hypothetical protein
MDAKLYTDFNEFKATLGDTITNDDPTVVGFAVGDARFGAKLDTIPDITVTPYDVMLEESARGPVLTKWREAGTGPLAWKDFQHQRTPNILLRTLNIRPEHVRHDALLGDRKRVRDVKAAMALHSHANWQDIGHGKHVGTVQTYPLENKPGIYLSAINTDSQRVGPSVTLAFPFTQEAFEAALTEAKEKLVAEISKTAIPRISVAAIEYQVCLKPDETDEGFIDRMLDDERILDHVGSICHPHHTLETFRCAPNLTAEQFEELVETSLIDQPDFRR